MHTPAWWEAYFTGSLDEEHRFSPAPGFAVGVVARGAERRLILEVGGERLETAEPALTWYGLLAIESAIQHPDRKAMLVALLQRFTTTAGFEADAPAESVRDAHRALGIVPDLDAFVDRTLARHAPRTLAAPLVRAVDALVHATPAIAHEYEFNTGATLLREARRTADKARKIECLRAAVEHFYRSSEQAVDDAMRANALCYSGGMLVELGNELPDAEAVLLYEQAGHRLEIASRLDPSHLDTRRRIADAFHHLGDRFCDQDPERAARIYGQAARYARELLAMTPPAEHAPTLDILVGVETMICDCLRRAGKTAAAAELLERVLADVPRIQPPTPNVACVYAIANRIDDALTALEAADGLTAAELLDNDFFDVLHGDPRWDALLAKR